MAVIEYKIKIDVNGKLTVTQDVLLIEATDKIRFSTNGASPNLAIRFPINTPFNDPRLAVNAIFPVTPIPVNTNPNFQAIPVANSNVPPVPQRTAIHFPGFLRRTFHFDCGQTIGGVFVPWPGSPGGDTPDGGNGN